MEGGIEGGHGLPERLGFLSKEGDLCVSSSEDPEKHRLHPEVGRGRGETAASRGGSRKAACSSQSCSHVSAQEGKENLQK